MKKISLIFIATLLFKTTSIIAQSDTLEAWRYMHVVSPDELTRSLDTRAFIETAPPTGPARSIAEFEPQAGVLIRYPFGIPMSLIVKLAEKDTVITIVAGSSVESTVRNQYIDNGVDITKCKFYYATSDSYWTRDYGPMFTMDGNYEIGCVDFIYNRPRYNDDNIARTIATFLNMEFYGMKVVHTGGNYMSDGYGTASSTTIVYTESMSCPDIGSPYGITNAQVDERMKAYLGINNHLVVNDPNNTYIDHIDCWGKFLGVDKVLIRRVPQSHAQYNFVEAMAQYWANQTTSWGNKYKVYRVDNPNNQPYTNSLILNKRVFVPQMGVASLDAAALEVYRNAMPGYEVIGITNNTSNPWLSTDALHCRTHEIADKGYLYISHYPDFEPREYNSTYSLSTKIKALSGYGFYEDSLRIYYRENNGDWNFSLLTPQEDDDNMFVGEISVSRSAFKVDYYFHAADSSGRSQHYPIVGEYDPFTFEINNSVLTFSDTEFIFDVIDSKVLTVSNFSVNPITIESVNNESMLYCNVIPVSESGNFEYPMLLNHNESISFKIFPSIGGKFSVRDGEYNIDNLIITTPDSTYNVVIKCNESLEDYKPELTFSKTEFVFDNLTTEFLTVSNQTKYYAITIESVNYKEMRYSEVKPLSDYTFPLNIQPGESFGFMISPKFEPKTDLRVDYHVDNLKITTADSVYCVVIKCNEDFYDIPKPELTLSATEFIFDEHKSEMLTVSNLTTYVAILESVNNFDLHYSFILPYPESEIFEYPLYLEPNESISFKVEPFLAVKTGLRDDYNIDILKLATPDSIYQVIIKCNPYFMQGIDVAENETISIYPNPFNETVTISCGVEKAVSCSIFDSSGRHITILHPAENNSFIWNPSKISKGVYFVYIKTNSYIVVRKIIKN